jgi:hypothetical protein
MNSLQRASAFLFYVLGALFIPLVILYERGMLPAIFVPIMHSLDLPLLFVSVLFGGSSLYISLTKGQKSLPLLLTVFVPIGVVFVVFCWLNFAIGFAEI